MLIVSSTNLKTAYSETLRRLLSESQKFEDPELFREDVATIQVQNHHELSMPLMFAHGTIQDPFPYTKYFPGVSQKMIDQEMRYWNQQFFEADKLHELIEYLKSFPLSKRGIILFWEERYRDLSKGAVCEIAAFFRIKNGQLESHTHMRANNATFLLFMDMRILMGIQRIVAKELGIGIGDYIHFIDSLHVYEIEKEQAAKQLELTSETLWQEL